VGAELGTELHLVGGRLDLVGDTPVTALIHDEKLRAEAQDAIDPANAAVSCAESIRSSLILPREFTVEDGRSTPSPKLRRATSATQLANEITSGYA
jgi:long-chain acyl-CoA synthetase